MTAQDPRPDTTHFGFRDVPVADKQKLVGEVFSSVASSYDLMNDLMSFGIHRVWKRYFVATAQVARGDRVLDLAGGTGDIAALLRSRVGDSGELVLGDINGNMLRVLKVGGQARVLEFSEVPDWFKPAYDFHSFKVLPKLGRLFANDADSYQYLAESIRKHPPQDELKSMMEVAGFARCRYRNLSGGIVAIHDGYKA